MSSSDGGNDPVTIEDRATVQPSEVDRNDAGPQAGEENTKKGNEAKEDTPPSQPEQNSQQYPYHSQLTPQPSGYYLGYGQQRATPEPPSQDVASFFQQQQQALAQGQVMSNIFGATAQYNGIPQPPLTPTGHLNVPASPLFPRPINNSAGLPPVSLEHEHGVAPPSPSVYLASPPLLPSGGAYPGYGVAASVHTPEDSTWPEGVQPHHQSVYQQVGMSAASPQLQAQGIPAQFVGMNRAAQNYRANSFDDMLPPSLLDQQEQHSPLTYSPYGPGSAAAGGSMFATQQPWGYGPSAEAMYMPGSPSQTRSTVQHPVPGQFPGVAGGMRQMGQFPGQQGAIPPYFPATSPGPPIQTTTSNKGPDGANLFIFHIPNHFTNLDMYHLFSRYGNLLSVRIMVEKDTGRSRGFGFVSYDNSESAAKAIKELNGFAIGNKRLKVQHKQIRSSDRQQDQHQEPYVEAESIPSANQWYESQGPAPEAGPQDSLEESNGDNANILDENNAIATENTASGLKGTEDTNTTGLDMNLAAGGIGNLESMRNALPDVTG